MNLFGKKAKALEQTIASQRAQLAQASIRELDLQRKIRYMDQLILAMSQSTSWDQMQLIYQTFADARIIDESNRIKQVLIPEMQKAYRQPSSNVPDYNWTQQQTASDFELIRKSKRGAFE